MTRKEEDEYLLRKLHPTITLEMKYKYKYKAEKELRRAIVNMFANDKNEIKNLRFELFLRQKRVDGLEELVEKLSSEKEKLVKIIEEKDEEIEYLEARDDALRDSLHKKNSNWVKFNKLCL